MKKEITGVELRSGRRQGNSTRQANAAIEIILGGDTCVVRDHWEFGHHDKANKHLFNLILDRLHNEHGLTVKGRLLVDKNKLEITLIPYDNNHKTIKGRE